MIGLRQECVRTGFQHVSTAFPLQSEASDMVKQCEKRQHIFYFETVAVV